LAIVFASGISGKALSAIEKVGAPFRRIWVLMGVLGGAVDHAQLIV